MFEKIKDFLFDIGDLVISIVIISLLFFAVTWKINDTFSVNFTDSDIVIGKETQAATTGIDTTLTNSSSESNTLSELATSETQFETSASETTVSITTAATTQTSTAPATTTTTTTTTATTTKQANSGGLIKFEVAAGSSAYSIANKLKSEGFIDNTDAFIKRAVELKLDSKLLSGTFQLSKSDTYDTILKVLSGGKR